LNLLYYSIIYQYIISIDSIFLIYNIIYIASIISECIFKYNKIFWLDEALDYKYVHGGLMTWCLSSDAVAWLIHIICMWTSLIQLIFFSRLITIFNLVIFKRRTNDFLMLICSIRLWYVEYSSTLNSILLFITYMYKYIYITYMYNIYV